MIGRRFAGWFYCSLALSLALVACSANQGGKYFKQSDRDVKSYTHVERNDATFTVPASPPSHVVNTDAGEVLYVKKDDKPPVRVTPLSPNERPKVAKEVLSPEDAAFKDADTAEKLAAFIDRYAPEELAFVAVQRLAAPAIDAHDWEQAKKIFSTYSDKFPQRQADFAAVIAMLEAPDSGAKVENLGPRINTTASEYSPVLTADGKNMLFARDCGYCEGGEQVYGTSLNPDGEWAKPYPFGSPLNTRGNEIPLAISADGNTLAVYGNYTGSLGRGDIFHLDKTPQGWTDLQHYPAPLNSPYFDSNAMYTADGKAILFVSTRPGGVGEFHEKGKYFHGSYNGNTDIYVYLPQPDGSGKVINLGNVINTPYAEYSPYLHPDGKTLYFSSDGHPGLGGLDVFKSTRLSNDSWTEWSKPVNLGKQINTPDNDWGYQFTAAGDKAYFAASDRPGGYGGSDIYSVTLPPPVKPLTVITVSGKVTDPEGHFLSATIRWNDLVADKEVGEATSDPQTGKYVINLPGGGKYGYYAEKPGYMGASQNLDLTDNLGYQEYSMDIVLYPVTQPPPVAEKPAPAPSPAVPKVLAVIRLNNIFFDFDRYSLRKESRLELNRWVKMLNENPAVSLEIDGYTDSIGTEAYNRKLSERRADSVQAYLIAHGIDKDRLTAKGFGESKPVASNATAEGRQRNRRVEVQIINNGQPQ